MLFAGGRRWVADRLERGTRFAGARWASGAWQTLAEPRRPVELPSGARVVGIGGATLGGSGKTPLTAALARAVSLEMPVAVAARAYRARPGRPRKVTPHDSPNLVGDEALALVRALGPGVPVVVAPERAGALHLAAELAPLVIADGLLQTRPRRIALSVLALDADAPWGSGACPPAGDLRAAPRELLLAADLVVLGSNEASTSSPWTVPDGRQVLVWRSTLLGARTAAGELLRVGHLAGLRLGIALAIARPGRVLRELAAHGIRPAVTRYAPDHARPTAGRGQSFGLDAWLATAKCATKLGPTLAGVPVWVLEHAVELPRELVAAALGRGPSSDAP